MKNKVRSAVAIPSALASFIESFEAYANATDDEILVLDQNYTVIRANNAFLKKTGWNPKDVEGRHCYEVSHGRSSPCVNYGEHCPLADTLSGGSSVRVTHLHRDQTGKEIYLDIVTSPIKDKNGNVVGAFESMRDVTLEKTLEKALIHRNEDLSILNNIISAGNRGLVLEEVLRYALQEILSSRRVDAAWIVLIDEETAKPKMMEHKGVSLEFIRTLLDMPLEKTLCGEVALSGRPLYIANFSEDSRIGHPIIKGEGLHAFMCVPLTSNERVVGSLTVARKNGSELSAEEIRLFEIIGEQLGVIAEKARLFSGLKKYANELEESRRRREEFSSMVSHELRNQFAKLKGWCQLLQRIGTGSAEKMVKDANTITQRIVSDIDGLTRLADDLDDISALEAGRFTIQCKPFDIVALSKQVVEQQQTLSEKHHLSLAYQREHIQGEWDPGRIRQVLENLIGNAIKYSPQGGEVVVFIEQVDTQVKVSVGDEGLGMSREEQQQIFRPYVRAHKEIKGKGLGLFICKGIIEAHGGRIWAESALGIGSTFYFTLPVN